jgi:hypothetical protein
MGRIDTYRSLYPNLAEGFDVLFEEEVDSWFTADIACCGSCYNEFCSRWPLVYLRDANFQESGIDLFPSFYSGSRMNQLFSEQDFQALIQKVECPRCGAPLNNMIWPYSFNFNLPDDFEQAIDEIGKIVNSTPFLLLQHSFAKLVLREVNAIGDGLAPSLPELHYRARSCRFLNSPTFEAFLPPPPSKTGEGRYNHAGLPVLYVATDPATCCLELGSPKDGVFFAQVRFLRPIRILDLRDQNLESNLLKAALQSSLLSAPSDQEGWHRPEYVFSRFLADCALASGIDAIKYPSVHSTRGDNLVVLGTNRDWSKAVELSKIERLVP